jgi:predicted PurR-regulated permease PerM
VTASFKRYPLARATWAHVDGQGHLAPNLPDYITDMTQSNRNTTTSDRLTTVLSYGTLVLLIYLVFRIVAPFLVPLAWSAVLGIFFYPIYEKLTGRLSPTLAALATTLGVTLLLILPVLFVMLYAAREAIDASAKIQAMVRSGSNPLPLDTIEALRQHLPESVQQIDFMDSLRQGAEKAAAFVAGSIGSILKNTLSFLLNLFILLFALFFMFRDGEKILRDARHLLPFEKELQDDMVKESRDLIFASVAVAVLIAAIQGLLGGLAFTLAGLPAPVFMGVLIAFFSIVPVVGSALIWVPAALWLAVNSHWGKALLVVAICAGVAGVADNLVRPLLLRNRTRLNDLLLFISILGGLEVFGLLGLVAGPTILAAALGVFRVYTERRDEMERKAV